MAQGEHTPSPLAEFRSVWAALGLGGRRSGFDRSTQQPAPSQEAATTRPTPHALAELDAVRAAFWDGFHHLFPQHAIASQTETGSVVISWSMAGDPHAKHKYAAPVVLRFEPELVELMTNATPEQRRRIAVHHEQALRAGLVGYDPYAAAQTRIIVLG